MQYAQRGNLSKAHSIHTSISIANGSDDELVELLQAKQPPPTPPMPCLCQLAVTLCILTTTL
eukprot:3915931-Rhodomonas_salina.1